MDSSCLKVSSTEIIFYIACILNAQLDKKLKLDFGRYCKAKLKPNYVLFVS